MKPVEVVALWIATYRAYPTVWIIGIAYEDDCLAECRDQIKKHEKWMEGRFEKRGPSNVPGSVETYWDTAFDLDYPVFEITKRTADMKG